MYFTKSKYVEYVNCPRAAWLTKHKPELRRISDDARQRMEEGSRVGEIAKGYWGKYVDTTAFAEDGGLDITHMLSVTQQYVCDGVETICEAAFSFGGLYCAVDILHRESDGYAIYEVKSSTEGNPRHIVDVAYQKYVLERCGVKVVGANMLYINRQYVREGAVDPKGLFVVQDVWKEVCDEQQNVDNVLAKAKIDLAQKNEPQKALCKNCDGCGYFAHCTEALPHPNVFDVHVSFGRRLKYFRSGLIDKDSVLDKIEEEYVVKHPTAQKVGNVYVDKAAVRNYLAALSYPLYFLDFETMRSPIPLFEGTQPNRQVPFQYSLRYIEHKDGEIKQKEYLAASGVDPRREVAERLVEDIPQNACVLAYSMSFEKNRIKDLADAFPDLAVRLMAIHNNIMDLLDPFKNKACYARAMEDSASIKYVLPALFPNEPDLNYHNLDGVHDGKEAMTIFPQIATMPPEKAQDARQKLLVYCGLDTWGMVKLWQKLIELVS